MVKRLYIVLLLMTVQEIETISTQKPKLLDDGI